MLTTSAQSGQSLCDSLRKLENTNSMKFCKDCKYFEPVEDKKYRSWFNNAEVNNLPEDFFTDWEHSKCSNSKTVTKDTYYTVNGMKNKLAASVCRNDQFSCGESARYYEEL